MPLVEPRLRRPAAVTAVSGAIVVAVLAGFVWHGGGTHLDIRITARLDSALSQHAGQAILGVTEPGISYGLMAAVVVAGLVARRVDVAVLAIAGPGLSLAATELLLKPLVGRHLGTATGSYPSGHETGVASSALVLVIVLAQLPFTRATRLAQRLVLLVWVVLAGVALVRNGYHWASDVVGALGVVVAVVVSVALAVDRVSSPAARSRPRTPRGS